MISQRSDYGDGKNKKVIGSSRIKYLAQRVDNTDIDGTKRTDNLFFIDFPPHVPLHFPRENGDRLT